MVDLKCDGSPTSRTQGQANLIIYGIEGNHSDVPADVYDKVFIFEDNKMLMATKLHMNNKRIINVKNPVNGDNPVNLGYLKGLETFIAGTFVSSYVKPVEGTEYIIRDNTHVFFGPHYLTFQIIPYDCLLTNLHCCLSCVSNGQYLMKINLFITKDGTYQTHYRFFSTNNTIHKKHH